MNICIFTESYSKGGLDTFLANLFEEWPYKSDKLTLYCNENYPGVDNFKSLKSKNVEIKTYKIFLTPNTSQKFLFKLVRHLFSYSFYFLWQLINLSLVFRFSNYDRLMVVNGGYPASLTCRTSCISWRLAGKYSRAILNIHNSPICKSFPFNLIDNFIDFFISKSIFCIATVSNNCLNSLKKLKFFNNLKLIYIYNGIKDPELSIRNIKRNKVVKRHIVMLSTFEKRKGHFFLFRAMQVVLKIFPNLNLHIYGDGTKLEKKIISGHVKKLKLSSNVFIHNFSINKYPIIKNADLLVVPSQEYESFGFTIIEAMSLSVPIVATNVGGIPEVLSNNSSGIICPKDDYIFFANAIISILKNNSLAKKMGHNGRAEFLRKFTARKMAKSYATLIHNNS
jgi:glycosyltransferase involved in cell wall biosynthesis